MPAPQPMAAFAAPTDALSLEAAPPPEPMLESEPTLPLTPAPLLQDDPLGFAAEPEMPDLAAPECGPADPPLGRCGLSIYRKDPRIVYKKEGYRYFEEMMASIRDKVTDLIFRARVVGRAESRSNYRETAAVHEEAGGYGVSENLAATRDVSRGAALGGEAHPAGLESPEQPEAQTAVKTRPIVRQEAKVGRNDPCPCGSGKKYKKCCGQHMV